MLTAEKTTTSKTRETGIDDEYFADIQKMFAKRDEQKKAEESARRAAARIQAREEKKLKKKRKIASTLSWINAFISGTAAYIFVIKWLDKIVAVGDSRFFGWCFFAYLIIVCVFGVVGEYIELRIWDKDYE